MNGKPRPYHHPAGAFHFDSRPAALVGYIPAMSKRIPGGSRSKLRRWRIFHLKAIAAELIGYLNALDEATAIKEAIRSYGITDPEKQKLLAARRVK
jgi:hypothetical protein